MNAVSIGAVLLASLLGSVHCVGMCGGFATVAGGRGRPGEGRRASWGPTVAYQGGRLLGYLGLGVVAGLLGAGLDLAGESLTGLQHLAGWLTGGVLVAMGLAMLWPRAGVGESLVTLGTGPARGMPGRQWLLGWLRRGGTTAAAMMGLGSALLPCGWLWGYVLVAASTGAVLPAAGVMLAFWAGALPALLSVGWVAGWLRRRLGRHAPRLVAGLMLLLGALALAGKLGAVSPAPDSTPEGEAPSCHHHE